MSAPAAAERVAGRDLGLLWGGVAVLMVLLAPAAPWLAALSPPCLFHHLTGYPCPTCGSTRAVLALARLDPVAALALNPLATVVVLAVVAGGLVAGLRALRGEPCFEPPHTLGWPARVALLLGLAANWAWVVWRGQ